MGIGAELREATGINQRQRESFAGFSRRLVEAVGKLADPEWNALSEEAQAWCNEVIDIINDADAKGVNPKVPVFPEDAIADAFANSTDGADDDAAGDDDNTDAPAEPEPTQTPVVVRGKGRNAGKSTNKRTRGSVGVTHRMKQIIAKKQDITIKQLLEQLEVEGYKTSENTVVGILSDFKQSLRILDEMGLLVK